MMARYAYGIRGSLPCHPGPTWCQGMAQALDGPTAGQITMSARIEGDGADEVVNEAIEHHRRTGLWPREVGESAEPRCKRCGKLLAE